MDKIATAISSEYSHPLGGYRVSFGSYTSFEGCPDDIEQLIAVIPIGCARSGSESYVFPVSAISADNIWGVSDSATASMYCKCIVLYR